LLESLDALKTEVAVAMEALTAASLITKAQNSDTEFDFRVQISTTFPGRFVRLRIT